MSSFIVRRPEQIFGADEQPSTLAQLLQWRARFQPERVAYTFLADGEAEETTLTYGELDHQARLIAQWLEAVGAAGERVLLLYPSDLEYVSAFFGCLYAGAVAVPAYPPRLNRTLHRLQAIVADSQAAFALSVSSLRRRIEPLCAQFPNLRALSWLTTDDLDGVADEAWQPPQLSGDTLAFLQYTSGSTGQPKGVMVRHDNLLHNQQLIQHAFGQTEQSIIVGWLPLYHDMGLIGNVLQTLYVGAQCVLMSPVAFLQSPFRWLQAISRFKATTSGGPNFAYDLCVRKISEEKRAQLDLSSWQVAFNGAEPVRPETLERFAAAFRSCGFDPAAFHPCYGLAEATLFVTGKARAGRARVELFDANELVKNRVTAPSHKDADGRLLVSSGVSPFEQKLLIVNPEALCECSPGEVGEIWVSSPSVAGGYWNQPEATERTFRARLDGDSTEAFLRTGDLGFLHDGELFVTGRLKDLIIIRGLNHYPQDIERTAEQSHTSLRHGCNVAFSLEVGGEERLVIVQEVERHRAASAAEIIDAIRQKVSEEHEVQVHAVALIRHGSIAKTSSGKIQRSACRASFLNGQLNIEAEWREAVAGSRDAKVAPAAISSPDGEAQATESAEHWLQASLASLLRIEPQQVDITQPITRYGLDSLMAVELSHAIEARFGVALPLSSLLDSISISELSARLRQECLLEPAPAVADSADSGSKQGGQPLSNSQQSLWFLHQLAPEDPTYNLAFAARIRAGLDTDSLRLAFQALVDRHPALRTTFSAGDGNPVQRIHTQASVSFQEHDATQSDEASLRELLAAEAQRPFDLESGPLLKVHLFARPAGEYVLLLAAHHIILDFWSLTILMHELGVLYDANRRGIRAELPPITCQHLDYVRWQEEMLRSETGERHRAYWHEQLSGPLPVLEIPTDRPRPPVQTYRGAAHSFRLSPELTRRLKALSQSEETTIYTTLLAAFQILLHRYTGQEEILVGSPTSGRSRSWLAGLVNYLVNPVVLRAELSGEQSFQQHLRRVRRNVLEAFEHQDYPFALLVKSLQPERDPSRSPIFQVMFALQKSHLRDGEGVAAFAVGDENARIPLGDLLLEAVPLPQRAAHFDLSLVMVELSDALVASLEYNTDLFDSSTIERIARHFEVLLASIVTDTAKPIAELPLLSTEERRRILVEWNETRRADQSPLCVHRQVERHAAITPHAPALCDLHRSLSYQQLNARANRLARLLRSRGVGPESIVALCAPRSFELVIGALAVLKAGGAYLPLDPAYPAERLRFMLDDSNALLLLTLRAHLEKLPVRNASVICLEEVWEPLSAEDTENLPEEVNAANLAYVIYTSGSTGRPKGVSLPHSALANLIRWHSLHFHLSSLDRASLLASVSFDASVWELWPYLCSGASIHLPDDETRSSPETLRDWLISRQITISFIPTPIAEPMLSLDWPQEVALRLLLTGGDKLRGWPAAQLPFAVINNYGPTENAVVTTSGVVESDAEKNSTLRAPSLGRPLWNVRLYILDERGEPVPIGVAGEIYVGGESLARGYLGRPALTAERFVPDQLSGEAGARLYRTGDLARYLPDGQIEFLGRNDSQVKLRGHRIELGEVEAALRLHQGINQSLALLRPGADAADLRLVAYVVAESGSRLDAAEVRRAAAERLPEYMVPAAIVVLEELPLTRNGKIDLNALPPPDFGSLSCDEAQTAARTQVEEVLLGIWAEVLSVERLGIHDNFFELGGHSLLATRIISRVRDRLNVEVPISRLFESPTVGRLADSIEQVMREGQGAVYVPIEPAPREEPLPLSFAQQRLWFFDQMEPGSSFYNISAVVRLDGRLNTHALERSFGEIVNRHEALRTRFEVVDGQPAQIITPALSWSLPVIDLRELPAEEREREVERRAAEEAQTPFDLSIGGLLRTTLLRLADEEHLLLLTMHHIVSDAWSVGILVRELTALYASFDGGAEPTLNSLPVQYADFARWQQQALQGDALAAQIAYWKQHLSGAPALLELPTDRPRPAVQSFRGATRTLALSQSLTEALKVFSRREGSTLFMTLLAAFKTLLFRYSGQTDIVVGTPIAGRNRADIEHLIGFFVNTQALRTQLSGAMSFRELLALVRTTVLEAHARQDLPFEKLVEELQPERSLSHSPIFQVMFALQNVPMPALELRGLTATPLETAGKTSKFDFSLSLEERGGRLVGTLEYNTDLFDAATMERLLGHYQRLLEDLVVRDDARVGELKLLTAGERNQLLVEWNETQRADQSPLCVHRQVERHAAITPHAPALCDLHRSLSYQQLNARANRLARLLRSRGVGPESIVALCAPRSFELVIGALAVLKAGGAYLPLDPAYPAERLRFMLDDSNALLLLTLKSLRHKFADTSATVIYLDAENETEPVEDEGNLADGATLENLAYVIYTSGSTGRPKGVSLPHSALANLIRWHSLHFRLSSLDRASLLASVSFDASVWELWPYLCSGASIHLPDDETRSSPETLRDWLISRQITISFIPTPIAEPMLSLDWPQEVALRLLLTGGDKLRGWPAAQLPFAVINNYGPTENAVVTTSGVVESDAEKNSTLRAPSLGRPLWNVRLYILDERGEPVPIGVAGEIYVGGESLARGYLGRAGLTAERFVPDQLSGEAGARLYRTGDLARYLPDGQIEFLGRIGNQVKVRGHRIELGEIETALREVGGVREALVECWEERGCERRLTAYVVFDENPTPATSIDLRGALREKLPEYMVPAFFVTLDAMPLTPNGKIDRRALPLPMPAEEEEETAAPRTPTEELLSNIWTEILGRRRIGVRDNFFDLGGHSLLATQVVSRLRETFNVELPLRAFFESPTIAELAASVERAVQTAAGATATPIERISREGDLPLSFAQQRLWFLDQLAPGNTAYNIQVSVRLTGRLDQAALEKTLNEVIRRHEALRTSFAVRSGWPVQVIASELTIPLSLTEVSGAASDALATEVRRLYAAEGRRPFDLARLPLLRCRLLRLDEEEHVLLLTMHHIISDGWSMGVLMREVTTLYGAYAAGQMSPLPELSIQYADFAHWQREWLRGEVLEHQLAYWKRQLGRNLPVLELPTDRPRPAVQSFRGERRLFTLDAGLAKGLRALSRREGVTLYMLMLAAFKALLYRYTSQDDVVVGTDIANRNRAEIEPLIGFFANQLVLRTDLSGNPTFRELLRRVREVTLGAYAHQDVPFEKLVEELQPERDLSRNPLFQVMFIFQNNPMPALEMGDLTVEQLELSEGTTAFDISLALTQTERGELGGSIRYSTDLFDAATIERLVAHYETVLRSVASDCETRLNSLEVITEAEKRQKAVDQEERKESKLKKLMSIRPKAVKLSERTILTETLLSPATSLPLVMQPEVEGVDLVAWAGQNRALVEDRLQKHGAILFRGFGARTLAGFQQFAEAIAPGLMAYGERSSPRHVLSGNVYTSTDHPADQYILPHNEQSYTLNWPMKIWFFCVRPAESGGRTPLADSRRMYRRLPAELVEKFAEKQVMYVRNYGDMLGLSWQEGFQTEDKAAVEEQCRRTSIEFEWKEGGRLRTKQIRPAIRVHPRTGETVWFNHAFFFNVASLEPVAREALRAGRDDWDLPFNTFYGDGSPIEPAVIEQIHETYRQEQIAFYWQTGDILLLDNMLVAHAREPFTGPREIAVAMGEPYSQLT